MANNFENYSGKKKNIAKYYNNQHRLVITLTRICKTIVMNAGMLKFWQFKIEIYNLTNVKVCWLS